MKKVFAALVVMFLCLFSSPAFSYSEDEIESLDRLMQQLFIESMLSVNEAMLERELVTKDESDEAKVIFPSVLAELIE